MWVEEVNARLTVLEAEQETLLADTDRIKVHMDLVTHHNTQLAGDSPMAEADNVTADTHRFNQTSTQDSQLLVELQNLQRQTSQTNGQLLMQNIHLYKQVQSLEQQMDESRQQNEHLKQQVQSLEKQNNELTTRQQTLEARMT